MNRRNFLHSILVAGASFSILPGAGRLWRARLKIPAQPNYVLEMCDNPINRWISIENINQIPNGVYHFRLWRVLQQATTFPFDAGDTRAKVVWEMKP